jgi:hypothetical protein
MTVPKITRVHCSGNGSYTLLASGRRWGQFASVHAVAHEVPDILAESGQRVPANIKPLTDLQAGQGFDPEDIPVPVPLRERWDCFVYGIPNVSAKSRDSAVSWVNAGPNRYAVGHGTTKEGVDWCEIIRGNP